MSGYDYSQDVANKMLTECQTENTKLEAEIERLRGLNRKLCDKSNFYLIDGARKDERIATLEAALREAKEALNDAWGQENERIDRVVMAALATINKALGEE